MSKKKQVAKVTVGKLKNGLNNLIQKGEISDEDFIEWSECIETPGSIFFSRDGYPIGTIILGLKNADGDVGTVNICPERTSELLS